MSFKISRSSEPNHCNANLFTQFDELLLVQRDNYPGNVRFYGAKGDGVTNDTAAIQAALDAVAPTGGCIVFPEGTYYLPDQVIVKTNNTRVFAYCARLLIGANLSPGNTWCDFNGISGFEWYGGRIDGGTARVSCFKADTTLAPAVAMSDFRFQDINFTNCFYAINIDGDAAARISDIQCYNLDITADTVASAGALLFRTCSYITVDSVTVRGGNGTAQIGFAQDCRYITVNNLIGHSMDDSSSVDACCQVERCNTAYATFTSCSSDHDILVSNSSFVTVSGCSFRVARVIQQGDTVAVSIDNVVFTGNLLARIENLSLGVVTAGSTTSAYFYNNTIYSTGVIYGGVAISISIFLEGTYISRWVLDGNIITGNSTATSMSLNRNNAVNNYIISNNDFGSNPIIVGGTSGIMQAWNNNVSVPSGNSIGNYVVSRFDAATTAKNSSTFANIAWETELIDVNNEFTANVFSPWRTGRYNVSGCILLQSSAPPVAGDRWELRLQRTDVVATIAPLIKHCAASTTLFSTHIYFEAKSVLLTLGGTYEIQYRNVDSAETGAGQDVNVLATSYVNITPFRG